MDSRRVGTGSRLARSASSRSESLDQHVQNPVAGGFNLLGEAVRPAAGRFWAGRQAGAFCPRQLGWCLPKVEPRGGSNAVMLPPKGRSRGKGRGFHAYLSGAQAATRAGFPALAGVRSSEAPAGARSACSGSSRRRQCARRGPRSPPPEQGRGSRPAVGVKAPILEGEQGAQIAGSTSATRAGRRQYPAGEVPARSNRPSASSRVGLRSSASAAAAGRGPPARWRAGTARPRQP